MFLSLKCNTEGFSAVLPVLETFTFPAEVLQITQFFAEEDQRPYNVWKLTTDRGDYVLKKTDADERRVYETFLKDSDFAPKAYEFALYQNENYMLMEYISGKTASKCDRRMLKLTLDALIESQDRFWENEDFASVGYGYECSYPNRQKRLPLMGDCSDVYSSYLREFASVPRTLCNDDLLPFNVIVSGNRAVIIDWEFAGILPYPCAVARLLAFGDEEDSLFQMKLEDKIFAVDYYYENLIAKKGISRQDYERTMKLFLFKEYSEWIYCAASSGDYDSENYKKYAPIARKLAEDLR